MSWQEELRDALKTTEELENFFDYPNFPKLNYPILIPKKFAKVIRDLGPNSSLWKQFLPDEKENDLKGFYDPIGDQNFSKAPQLVHRYKNRALFFPTQNCPVICRYCFRKNELSSNDDIFKSSFQKTLDYLNEHPEIEEIIFSGGDPLVLSSQKIDFYLNEFLTKTKIKYIRFHSRTPIILPSRIDDELCELLKKYSQKFLAFNVAIHMNHIEEITADATKAFSKLASSQINLLSQTVLLKGVNDSYEELVSLFQKMAEFNIRPYYLHHPDQVKGGYHFYLPLPEGREIYARLRQELPGWLIPHYVIDIPGGEGKVQAFNPEAFDYGGKLINREARLVSAPL